MKHYSTRFMALLSVLCFSSFLAKAQYTSSQFSNTIPIPYLTEGTTSGNTISIDLDFDEQMHSFDPGGATKNGLPLTVGSKTLYKIDPKVRTWGINSSTRNPSTAPNMTYLGATVLWHHGKDIAMTVTNNLPSNSSTEPGHGETTTSHWHGLNVHAQGDGGPHQPIPNTLGPTNPWKPTFPMVDPAQTIWYHSHVMEYTTEQVIMGAAGLIIVEDHTTAEARKLNTALPHSYGVNDMPLVIQEKGFIYDTVKKTNDTLLLTATKMNVGEQPGNGEFRIINGIALGQMKVPNSMVRLRILNGDPRKSYNIGFSTDIDTSNHGARLTFYQVATDGGYMGKAHPITEFLISPGERGEFVVDFGSGNLGTNTEVFMSNRAADENVSKAEDIVGLGAGKKNNGIFATTQGLAFMKFVVDANISVDTPITELPAESMFPKYELQSCPAPKERTKTLSGSGQGENKEWTINGKGMDMMVLNDTICVNTCEKWTIKNETNVAHPFHIHKVQFQVLEYIDKSSGTDVTYTYPNLPSYMMGFKDVMLVREFSQYTFQARFDDFGADKVDHRNGYMFHCHILTHEDNSMMHQFTVVNDSVCNALGLGTGKPILPKSFSLYPNPAGNQLYLKGDANREGVIRFTDLKGRTLKQQRILPFEGEMKFDVSDLPRGLIMVDFIYGKEHYSKRILLE